MDDQASSATLTDAQRALAAKAAPLVDAVVRRVAARFPRGLPDADLRGHAQEGLVAAAQSFDPSLGVPFEGYAWFRMQGAAIDALRAEDKHRRLHMTVRAASRRRLATLVDPSDALNDDDDKTQSHIDRILAAQVAVMMQAAVREAARMGEEGVVERETYARAVQAVRRAQARLPARDQQLLDLHYRDGLDLKQVATAMNVSYATVRRYHDGVLDRLAAALRHEGVAAAPEPSP